MAALEHGGVIIWDTPGDTHQIVFAEELAEPEAALNRGGWLIAASDHIQVFATEGAVLTLHGRADIPAGNPIAARHADQFAVCTAAGKILLFKVS